MSELLHSLSDLVCVGLNLHSEHKCILVFCLLQRWLSSQGELDGTVVKPVSPVGALLRTSGGLRSRSVLGFWKVGDVWIFLFLWLWTPFRTAFFGFIAFASASALGEGQGLASLLSGPSWSTGKQFLTALR